MRCDDTPDAETPKANAVLVIDTLELKLDGVVGHENAVHAMFDPLPGKPNTLDLDLRPIFRQPDAGEHVALRIEDDLWLYLDRNDPEGKLGVVALGYAALTFPWIFLGGATLNC